MEPWAHLRSSHKAFCKSLAWKNVKLEDAYIFCRMLGLAGPPGEASDLGLSKVSSI